MMSYANYKKAPGESPLKAVRPPKAPGRAQTARPLTRAPLASAPPVAAGAGGPLRKVRWGAATLWEGEPILLLAEVLSAAVPDGTPVRFRVYQATAKGRGKEIKALEGKAKAGLAKAEWTWTHEPTAAPVKDDEKAPPYEPPRFLFEAEVKGAKLETPARPMQGRVKVEVVDEDGTPLAGMHAELTLADGVEKTLPLDDEGKADLKPLPPGSVKLVLADQPRATTPRKSLLK